MNDVIEKDEDFNNKKDVDEKDANKKHTELRDGRGFKAMDNLLGKRNENLGHSEQCCSHSEQFNMVVWML